LRRRGKEEEEERRRRIFLFGAFENACGWCTAVEVLKKEEAVEASQLKLQNQKSV